MDGALFLLMGSQTEIRPPPTPPSIPWGDLHKQNSTSNEILLPCVGIAQTSINEISHKMGALDQKFAL